MAAATLYKGGIEMKKLEDFPAEWVDIVTEEMLQLGVPVHLKGYQYIRMALLMTLEDPEVVCQVTKLLYPDLAKCYEIPDSKKIERSIRNAIEVSWARGDVDYFRDVFGYSSVEGCDRPTNSEYLAVVADKINLTYGLRTQALAETS